MASLHSLEVDVAPEEDLGGIATPEDWYYRCAEQEPYQLLEWEPSTFAVYFYDDGSLRPANTLELQVLFAAEFYPCEEHGYCSDDIPDGVLHLPSDDMTDVEVDAIGTPEERMYHSMWEQLK
jgi:hypothetical protein